MIIVVAETQDNKIKKSAREAVYFGAKYAEANQDTCVALVLCSADDAGSLGSYGASAVHHANDAKLDQFDAQVFATVIASFAAAQQAKTVVLADSANGKNILGMLAVKMGAGAVRGVNALPEKKDGKMQVEKRVFSGKAFATCRINADKAVISVAGNSIKPQVIGSEVSSIAVNTDIPAAKTKVISTKRSVGIVPLPEAEVVVSAGRGMKDPSNWNIIESLADAIGATTACSRPVADSGWRPHHEHVGQTGIAIRPNLYIAIGISGAIQHLAGVNSSKVIVVINKDPEAPFFKAADYGVVGDLFEVVPRLTEAFHKFKASH